MVRTLAQMPEAVLRQTQNMLGAHEKKQGRETPPETGKWGEAPAATPDLTFSPTAMMLNPFLDQFLVGSGRMSADDLATLNNPDKPAQFAMAEKMQRALDYVDTNKMGLSRGQTHALASLTPQQIAALADNPDAAAALHLDKKSATAVRKVFNASQSPEEYKHNLEEIHKKHFVDGHYGDVTNKDWTAFTDKNTGAGQAFVRGVQQMPTPRPQENPAAAAATTTTTTTTAPAAAPQAAETVPMPAPKPATPAATASAAAVGQPATVPMPRRDPRVKPTPTATAPQVSAPTAAVPMPPRDPREKPTATAAAPQAAAPAAMPRPATPTATATAKTPAPEVDAKIPLADAAAAALAATPQVPEGLSGARQPLRAAMTSDQSARTKAMTQLGRATGTSIMPTREGGYAMFVPAGVNPAKFHQTLLDKFSEQGFDAKDALKRAATEGPNARKISVDMDAIAKSGVLPQMAEHTREIKTALGTATPSPTAVAAAPDPDLPLARTVEPTTRDLNVSQNPNDRDVIKQFSKQYINPNVEAAMVAAGLPQQHKFQETPYSDNATVAALHGAERTGLYAIENSKTGRTQVFLRNTADPNKKGMGADFDQNQTLVGNNHAQKLGQLHSLREKFVDMAVKSGAFGSRADVDKMVSRGGPSNPNGAVIQYGFTVPPEMMKNPEFADYLAQHKEELVAAQDPTNATPVAAAPTVPAVPNRAPAAKAKAEAAAASATPTAPGTPGHVVARPPEAGSTGLGADAMSGFEARQSAPGPAAVPVTAPPPIKKPKTSFNDCVRKGLPTAAV